MTWSDAKRKKKLVENEMCGACECPSYSDRMVSSARAVADLQSCRMTGVASHECQSRPEGFGSQAASGTPRLTQALGQATECDEESPCERVAYQVALRVVPTTDSTMQDTSRGTETKDLRHSQEVATTHTRMLPPPMGQAA